MWVLSEIYLTIPGAMHFGSGLGTLSRGRSVSILVVVSLLLGLPLPALASHPPSSVPVSAPLSDPGSDWSPPSGLSPASIQTLSCLEGRFTENLGQLGAGAGDFYCQGAPLSVALGKGWATYYHSEPVDGEGVLVRVDFEGSTRVRPVGSGPMEHVTNYMIGSDPSAWMLGVSSFREVVYPGLYEGIDLRYLFADGMLKYEFIVAPNADIGQIKLRYVGTSGLRIDRDTGDLVIRTPVVELRDAAPVALQGGGAPAGTIRSRYVLLDESSVAFDVDGARADLPLVIDPGLTFSTYLGGSAWEEVDIAVDDAGDIYLCGMTYSWDFPTTPGVVSEDPIYGWDVFACKLRGDGSSLLFSTYIGGDDFDIGEALALDAENDLLIVGCTYSNSFPVTTGTVQTYLAGDMDCFVLELSGDGTSINWCTLLGGSDYDRGMVIQGAPDGDVVVAGFTYSGDFPFVDGCYEKYHKGHSDLFVSRLSYDGTELVASTYLGGACYDELQYSSLTLDGNGDVYLFAYTTAKDFPTTPGAYKGYTDTLVDVYDSVVVKMDGHLRELIYSTYLGGSTYTLASAIEVDGTGCAYVIGRTWASDFPTTPGAFSSSKGGPGGSDTFLAKLSADGSTLLFGTYFGSDGNEWGNDLELGPGGLVYFVMNSTSTMLPTTSNAPFPHPSGRSDFYVGVLDSENQTLRFGTYIGGSGDDGNTSRLILRGSVLTVSGYSWSADFPTTNGAWQNRPAGMADITISRFDFSLERPVISKPPTNLTASLDNGSVRLAWEAPSDPGSYARYGYAVRRGVSENDLSIIDVVPPERTAHLDVPPSIGVTYYYSVEALVPPAKDLLSNVANVTFFTPPDPPSGLALAAGVGMVVLNWLPPERTGGLPVLGYCVYRGLGATEPEPIATLGRVTEYTDLDIAMGLEYSYQVCAFNSVGNSTRTPPLPITPVSTPSAPRNLTMGLGDASVMLRWEPPLTDGGRPLMGYSLFRGPSPSTMTVLVSVGAEVSEYMDRGIEIGVTYFYTVGAFNNQGNGPRTPAVSATPITVPGAPRDFRVTAGLGQAELLWSPPESDGGSPVLGFVIHRGVSGSELAHYAVVEGSNSSYIDGAPPFRLTLYYAVSAYSIAGEGPLSPTLSVKPPTAPEPPSDVSAKPGLRSVSVSWGMPVDDGGSPIMNFVIYRGTSLESLEPLQAVETSQRFHLDTGLVPGRTYFYALATTTVVTEGPLSAIVKATPFDVPTEPRSLAVGLGEDIVELTWTHPYDDGGRPVLLYRIYRGPDPTSMTTIADVEGITSYIDAAVAPGESYYYTVAAINEGGEGPRPLPIGVAVPAHLPGAPKDLAVVLEGRAATLTWHRPSTDGGSAIIGYAILRGTSADALVQIAYVRPLTVYVDTDLGPGRTYHYAIAAVSMVGRGELSTSVSVSIAPAPSDAGRDPLEVLGALSAVMALIVAAAAVSFETVRYNLLVLWLPLFTRLKRKQVLDNNNRYSIHGLIIDRPGVHFAGIIEALGLPMGVVTYHLEVLERENYVQTVRDGRLKRFYSTDTRIPKSSRMVPEEMRRVLVELIAGRPGISQKEVIREIGVDRETVGYHLRELVTEGRISHSKRGRYTVYWVAAKRIDGWEGIEASSNRRPE